MKARGLVAEDLANVIFYLTPETNETFLLVRRKRGATPLQRRGKGAARRMIGGRASLSPPPLRRVLRIQVGLVHGHEVESADRGRAPVAEDAQPPTPSGYFAHARVPGKKGRDL